jgi:hypothetical protein
MELLIQLSSMACRIKLMIPISVPPGSEASANRH